MAAFTSFTAIPGDNQVLLSWSTVEGAAYYRVFQGFEGMGQIQITGDQTETYLMVTSLTNGVEYTFNVQAFGEAGFLADTGLIYVVPPNITGTVKITYDSVGGTPVSGPPFYLNSGDLHVVAPAPTRSTGSFSHWVSNISLVPIYPNSSYSVPPIPNLIFTAVWTYSVSYNANGGAGTLPSGESGIAEGGVHTVVSNPSLTKSGYSFGGWTSSRNTDSNPVGESITLINEDIILTAIWNGIAPAPGGNPVCFLGNAPVLTPSGYRRIDSLAVGDMVRTADGRDVAIQRVKHQRILAPSAAVNPFVIPKGTWGATENLAISPRHAVAVPGRGMVEARELGLRQMSMRAAFDYYNLELPEWDNMVVAGVEVESLAPKKRVVMSAAEFRRLVAAQGLERDLAKLSRFVEMLEDGRVAVSMTQRYRRHA